VDDSGLCGDSWCVVHECASGARRPAKSHPNKFKNLEFREIGPRRWEAHRTDFRGRGEQSETLCSGHGIGGVWKTTNNGTTWEPNSIKERVDDGDIAIGAV